ncbi:MAG: arsenite methyltransferase [Chloroflexi bacterium]|nr:arsenite methyltransferase [Chloroflexota bacterium]
MATTRDSEIRQAVQERYSKVARGATSCCESSCCSESSALYTVEELKALPAEAVAASAGCGNPAALASLKPGETVVDFGGGGGIDCFLAAREVGPQGRVIGVDMTPDMVRLARSNAQKLGIANVEFHLTEMESTPIPDSSADVIISNCVINLSPDKDAVFREAFRILRPGGRMFVSDMMPVEPLPEQEAANMRNWVECLSGAELKSIYLGRIENAGFQGIEVLSEAAIGDSEGWRAKVRSVNIKAVKPA